MSEYDKPTHFEVLAAIIAGLSRGADLGSALDLARTEFTRHNNHAETSTALATAIELAAHEGGRMPAPEVPWLGPTDPR
ncbi:MULTISPECIES: hypothetical protein [unclassified Nocardia]|uniref:hypothetical protein n=1 Tax=unclassified Nocardia TaxID=2637762 RepID=UPI003428619D